MATFFKFSCKLLGNYIFPVTADVMFLYLKLDFGIPEAIMK